jgi:GFO/IDH/MocA oxidoreductase family protein
MPVGVIGFGWMGRVHAQAYSRLRHHYPHTPRFPELVAIADDVPGRAEEAARQFGAETAVGDWQWIDTITAGRKSLLPTADDGLRASQVTDALVESMNSGGAWVKVGD